MTPGIDLTLLSRIEDAGLNASAPWQQRWLDGWLVRFAPDKARRARCVNAVARGRLSTAAKLEICAALYEAAGLPLCMRMTPFSQPPDLEDELDRLGWAAVDETQVMVSTCIHEKRLGTSHPAGARLSAVSPTKFAEAIGDLQGTPAAQRAAHADRLLHCPVACESFVLAAEDGTTVACGQLMIEGAIAGLYGVHTAASWRGRGLASSLCDSLLARAADRAASVAYLQVEVANEGARRLYRRLGFIDAYRYHYRMAAPPAAPL